MTDLAANVTLTVDQRAQFLDLIRDDPYRGHVAAARAAGIEGSTFAIRRALKADDELQVAIEEVRREKIRSYGLAVPELLERLAILAHAPESRDQFKATVFALGLNGVTVADRQQVEHTGADGGPVEVTNPDVAAALDRFNATIRRLQERAESGGNLRQAEPGRAELPPGNARS